MSADRAAVDLEHQLSPLAAVAERIRQQLWSAKDAERRHDTRSDRIADAACTAIAQADLSLTSFLTRNPDPTPGRRYLLVHGLLQALYVQQTASQELHKAVRDGAPYPLAHDETLRSICVLRNGVAHPSEQERHVPAPRSVRVLISPGGADSIALLYSFGPVYARIGDGASFPMNMTDTERVDVRDLIQRQRDILSRYLEDLAVEL